MVSETSDVQVFLAQHPPFNHLSESQLELASSKIYVAFSKSGNELELNAAAGGEYGAGMIVVRSGSLEVRDEKGALIDRLSEGDYIVPSVLYSNADNIPRVFVLEDCLYYELDNGAFQSLVASSNEIAAISVPERSHASQTIEEINATTQVQDQQPGEGAYLSQYIKDTMTKVIVYADPKMSIRKAAQLMREHHISSLLIKDHDKLVGIITDRDFRIRVLAGGVPDDTPINVVMTHDPMCIDAGKQLHDAQLKMMAEGIRHLPVVEDDRPVGIISQTDILRANNAEPITLIHAINRASDTEALSLVAGEIPALIVKLIARDTRAIEVGKIITSLSDGITRRLISLAIEKFGEPPCDYAWLAFGSQARQEQVLGSDQDNGLLLPDGVSEQDAAYFKDFAEFINDGLDQCGMPYCPGDIMAKNQKWRLPLQGWKKHFSGWIDEPHPKAVMHSSIFFDMRHISGNAELTRLLQDYVLKRAKKNTIFMAMMCDNALSHSPPLGFFKTFVLETDGDHNHTLDLKKRGTIPIVDIARNYALSVGLAPLNTLDRLRAIARAGAMSMELANSLIDAHEFIAGIRLEAQGNQFSAGIKPDNYLDPKELSPLVRHQLKDAFSVVRDAQTAMKTRFGGGVI